MALFEDARGLADLFRAQARARPDATAQVFGERVSTYAMLDRRASQVANRLIALGARPGTRIGYLGKNSDLYFELLLGALKAKIVLVAVNWRLAPPEAATILADAGVDILFVGAGFTDAAEAIAQAGHVTRHRIAMEGFADWRGAEPKTDPMLPATPDDTVIQLYTSGTTGLPKGVELTNRNYLALLTAWEAAGFGDLGPADVVLTCMPLFHVAGVNMGILALAYGCTNVVMEEVSVAGVLDLIARHRVTVTLLVPAVVLALVQHPDAPRANLRSLRRLLYGASPIAEDTVLRAKALLPGTELWQLYGLTETNGGGTYLPPCPARRTRREAPLLRATVPGLRVARRRTTR
ncbi:MAG: AMP-binding protein [Acetobacteraceae bacterium]